ncbi:MAG: DNA topoisomerase III [Betaproteobacteria bacterium]|nr:DNA topoisomerase III [Betaproteobacteria bacterium]
MGKRLIIAEKPSVAADIARALGGFTRHTNYYESDDFVLSYAVGHLLELSAPEQFDPKRGRWSFRHLPVIPPHFDLAPINSKSASQLGVLLKLIRRKDVSGLINACDAGREGELIFRYIVQHAESRKPIERLWLQSMTPAAIREGFGALRPDKAMLALADAAKCRSEADWLVGINGTRAMTAFNSREGGFYKTTMGRVQTPTLAVLVEREERIRNFAPRDYWEVRARFAADAGEYDGRWFNPAFKREDDPEKRAERLWSATEADLIVAACRGKTGKVSEETKPATQLSPLLFDLTSLQREANSRFGFSAKTTLSLAQALYERHKVLTYPRTDSRALPEDYVGTVKKTLSALEESPYAPFAGAILKHGWAKPNKRVFNNTKISDHFAIIPTLQAPGHLNDLETRLYDLVVRRFLAVFYPAAESLQTLRITAVGDHQFKTEGRILQNPGWLAVYGRTSQEENESLPRVAPREDVCVLEIAALANQTRPPPRYTEATLLSAMEGAGKLVEDDELRAAMEAKGLGTPATRAAIIEGLIQEEYVHRNGKELVPTPKAFSLLFALKHFGVTEITSPELTGDWEYQLKLMETDKLRRQEFMEHIESVTRDLVERIKNGDIPDTAFATVPAPCPKCGGLVQENYRKFQCQKCDFSMWRVLSGREWAPEEVAELFRQRFVGPLTGFRSRAGKPFSAGLRLSADLRIEFDFGLGTSSSEKGEPPDFSSQTPLGKCPKCGARVFEHGAAYVCEDAVSSARSCDFRSGRMILQQPIEPEQMRKLLAGGRTDLLTGFVSRRNGRKFKAYLVASPGGRVGFEFEAKTPRAAARASRRRAKEAPDAKAPKPAASGRRSVKPKPTGQSRRNRA